MTGKSVITQITIARWDVPNPYKVWSIAMIYLQSDTMLGAINDLLMIKVKYDW